MKKNRQRYWQWVCVAVLCVLVMQTAGTTAIAHAEFGPIEKSSNIVSDYIRRGEELRRKWDLEAAGEAFREAVRLEPKSLDAKLGLARIARVRLQYSQSLNLLDNAAKEHPDNASLLCEYGSLYLAVEEPERAYKYFERVSSISENNSATIGLAAVD